MKVKKGISLFFIYSCMIFAVGMYAGFVLQNYFYPGKGTEQDITEIPPPSSAFLSQNADPAGDLVQPVSVSDKDVLDSNTEYILEEYDTRRGTLVESSWKLPEKYMGMDREDFTKCMEIYAASPPLSELKRGFVGLEVRSFSSQRVVVRMNYTYVQPTETFYLKVENNNIVVYCDDLETVYMYTVISAMSLPEYIKTQVVAGMLIENEAALYQFLETYSS